MASEDDSDCAVRGYDPVETKWVTVHKRNRNKRSKKQGIKCDAGTQCSFEKQDYTKSCLKNNDQDLDGSDIQHIMICDGGSKPCGQPFTEVDCITCEGCGERYHPKCQGLSENAVSAVRQFSLPWLCWNCHPKVKAMLQSGKQRHLSKQATEANASAEIKSNEVEQNIEQIQRQIADMEKAIVEQIKEQQNKMELYMNEQKETFKTMPTVTAEQMVQAKDDRENRERNVLLHNIPECASQNPDERKQYDIDSAYNIAEALYPDDTSFEVEEVYRLGKLQDMDRSQNSAGRPRLMLIKFRDKESVNKLIKRRTKLRHVGFSNIYVTRDLSPNEREIQRKLREELLEKGKTTHHLFRGKILPNNLTQNNRAQENKGEQIS